VVAYERLHNVFDGFARRKVEEAQHHQPPSFLSAIRTGVLIALLHQLRENFRAHWSAALDAKLKNSHHYQDENDTLDNHESKMPPATL
jgi:hypothetical protein